eukprot:c16320_g1_i2 orf=213-719(-)
MILTALEQFGDVLSVDILSNPLDEKFAPKRAIVEMKDQRQASYAIKEIKEHPFMIRGVPRPVTARPAYASLFHDRPRKYRKSKINFRWVEADDPDRPLFMELKRLAKRHAAETVYLTQELRKEEEKRAREQEEKVKENIKKLDEISSCVKDNTIHRLSKYYGIKYDND